MPWTENSSLQLQDMYDQVYSHLIRASKHQRTTLQILGQVILAQSMPVDMDTSGSRLKSSPNSITANLGLEHGSVTQIVTELHPLLEVGNEDDDIKIRHPSFVEFLLDPSRSQELCVDIDEARSLVQDAPTVFNKDAT